MSLLGTVVSTAAIRIYEKRKTRAAMQESLCLNLDWANGMIERWYQKEEKSSN